MSRLFPLVRSTGRKIWKSVEYATVPLGFFGAKPTSMMIAFAGSFGSTSPMICPLMRSYGPTAPKLLPPNVGDSVLAITTLVTRACTVGALKRTTPVNERQQTTAVVENGVLVMRILPGAGSSVHFLCRSYRQERQDGSWAVQSFRGATVRWRARNP